MRLSLWPCRSRRRLPWSDYRSGNWLWVFDQIWSFWLLVVVLATGLSARMRISRSESRASGSSRCCSISSSSRWSRASSICRVPTTRSSSASTPTGFPTRRAEMVDRHADGSGLGVRDRSAGDLGPVSAAQARAHAAGGCTAALALIPFIIAGNLVAPIWIAPLFNRFGPMQDKALEAQILGAGRPGRHRGQPRVRSGQERRHENAQRLRRRLLQHQAHRALGHDHRAHDETRNCSS